MRQDVGKSACWALLLTLVFVAGCSNRPLESDLGIDDAPDWVNEGTQAVDDRDGRLIQGVGVAPAMGDISLQRATADSRARAEIAKVLATYINTTLDAYSRSEEGLSQSSIQQILMSSTEMALAGSRIQAHWRHAETGDLYAFAELDLDQLESTLAESKVLNSGFRTFLKQQGPSHFERLSKED